MDKCIHLCLTLKFQEQKRQGLIENSGFLAKIQPTGHKQCRGRYIGVVNCMFIFIFSHNIPCALLGYQIQDFQCDIHFRKY